MLRQMPEMQFLSVLNYAQGFFKEFAEKIKGALFLEDRPQYIHFCSFESCAEF